jgi:hypothetical protein
MAGQVKVVKLSPSMLELRVSVSYDNKTTWEKLSVRNKRIFIKNDYNALEPDTGNPEMPVIKVEAKIRGLDDINDPQYGKTINWEVKIDYKVNIPSPNEERSRGLEKATEDGLILTISQNTVNEALLIESDRWGDFIGGGELTITATVPELKDGKNIPYRGEFKGTIEGERTTVEFRTQMINYLKEAAKTGSPSLETELGSPDILFVLACVESYGVNHFYPPAVDGDRIPNGSEYGIPGGSNYPLENTIGDGGFGVMQLTKWGYAPNPTLPTYEQIWNWKKNIDTSVEVVKQKIAMANSQSSDMIPSQKRMNVYSLFRGGYYWKKVKNSKTKTYNWIPRYNKNSEDDKERENYFDSGVYEADKAVKNEGKSTCQ